MLEDNYFCEKKILVIDQTPKITNDRTWCFWEKSPDIFESVVYHQWKELQFYSDTYSVNLPILPYHYKMIRGIDLYGQVREASVKCRGVIWHYDKVKSIESLVDKAIVHTETSIFTADYVFNSIPFHDIYEKSKRTHHLKQHFLGWLIETEDACFDPGKARFMDFRVSQQEGTTFMYLMPVSTTKALVEYTLFTEEQLQTQDYESALAKYLSKHFPGIKYRIEHREFGIIPMTNKLFPFQNGRVVNMGVAGGQAKGSTGYAFKFIQKRARLITESLKKNQQIKLEITWKERKFRFYDSVLLRVLCNHKMKGDVLFTEIFRKNPPGRILRFLDNETSLWEDLLVMRTVPTLIFLKAALREFFR